MFKYQLNLQIKNKGVKMFRAIIVFLSIVLFELSLFSQTCNNKCQISIPASDTSIPVNVSKDIIISTVNCTGFVRVKSGSLPTGMNLQQKDGSWHIVGTPTASSTYSFVLTSHTYQYQDGTCWDACYEKCHSITNNKDWQNCINNCKKSCPSSKAPNCVSCSDCSRCNADCCLGICDDGNNSFTITVTDSTTPDTPQITQVESTPLPSDANNNVRSKSSFISSNKGQKSKQNFNVIEWKEAKHGPKAAGFSIYRDKRLTQRIARIPNFGKKNYTFSEVAPRKQKKYYVVAYALNGSISKAAVAKIKKKK